MRGMVTGFVQSKDQGNHAKFPGWNGQGGNQRLGAGSLSPLLPRNKTESLLSPWQRGKTASKKTSMTTKKTGMPKLFRRLFLAGTK
jgi:hypothetical protein